MTTVGNILLKYLVSIFVLDWSLLSTSEIIQIMPPSVQFKEHAWLSGQRETTYSHRRGQMCQLLPSSSLEYVLQP